MKTFNENENKVITDKELKRVFWRSFQMEFSWNYERQMSLAYVYALIPVLEKIYTKKEELSKALKRHLEFFNITPHICTFMLGISAAMEEENKKENNLDENSVNNIKTALMGPLSGIGDSFFWGTLRLVATGIGTSLALKGNILGPILFLLIFNIPHIIVRYLLTFVGYKFGIGSLKNIEKSGNLSKLTYGASILGVFVVGSMAASLIDINIPLTIGKTNPFVLQDILNDIMPGIPQVLAFGVIYYLLGKNFKPVSIILGIAIFGIIMAFLGVL